MATKSKKKTSTRKRSQADRDAQMKELQQRQRAALENLISNEEEWTAYLKAGRLFRNYSAMNSLLILLQCPEATRVAGFSVWKELERKVVSGPGSSLKIWGKPYHPTYWTDASGVDESKVTVLEREGDRVRIRANWTRCPILSVFDVSQTDGKPLPEIAVSLTDEDADEVAKAEAVASVVKQWLTKEGWTVLDEQRIGAANGSTNFDNRVVRMSQGLSVVQYTKTLLHEAAHVVLHGDNTWADMDQYGTSEHRGVAEIQAESVAYTVASAVGLDTSSYSTGYVAHWGAAASGSDKVDEIIATVEKVAAAVRFGTSALLDVIEGEDSKPATKVSSKRDITEAA